MCCSLPSVGDAHVAVDLIVAVIVPEEYQQIVGVREHIQRYYYCEEHCHPGTLKQQIGFHFQINTKY